MRCHVSDSFLFSFYVTGGNQYSCGLWLFERYSRFHVIRPNKGTNFYRWKAAKTESCSEFPGMFSIANLNFPEGKNVACNASHTGWVFSRYTLKVCFYRVYVYSPFPKYN